jgi:hypothetical protein
MNFMLNVARLDPNAFEVRCCTVFHHSVLADPPAQAYSDDFVSLLFQIIVTDSVTVEHQYVAALFRMPGSTMHPLLEDVVEAGCVGMDRSDFLRRRMDMIQGGYIPGLRTSARKWS